MMILTFWILLFLVIYCYFGYPLCLSVLAHLFKRPIITKEFEPTVTMVLSVWNEEDVIKDKIDNILSLEYPHEKLEILIGSDGSTDRTNLIIEQFSDPRIRLIQQDERKGKMATINRLVELARNKIILFTDARQKFDNQAIKALVKNFSDSKVGCVSGELIFSGSEDPTAKGISLYWSYEKFIRRKESDIHSMLGATGAIYAVRRELFSKIPENIVLDDMYVPLRIIQKGYRAVLDTSAHAYDKAAESPKEEHRRKTRTLFGNYQIFWVFRGLFNPLKSPVAVQLFSHKLLRVLIPFFMIAVFLINAQLLQAPMYKTLFIFQVVFYLMAITGGLARNQKYGILKNISRICYVPYVFCLLNFSALIGFLRFAGSKQNSAWEKARSQ